MKGGGVIARWLKSSKPIEQLERGCLRKNVYRSEAGAKKAADKRKIIAGKDIFYYSCRHCKMWHLTSLKQKEPVT